MATRNEFLNNLWADVINSPMQEYWIDNSIRESKRQPKGPFGEIGPIVEHLLALGASRQELSLLVRFASYEAVFDVLYKLGDPGVDDGQIEMLHEELLVSDPSGMDGAPGSAPAKNG